MVSVSAGAARGSTDRHMGCFFFDEIFKIFRQRTETNTIDTMFPDLDFLLPSSEPPEGPTCLCSLGQNLPLGHLSEAGGMWELCYVVKSEMMTSDGLGSSLTD